MLMTVTSAALERAQALATLAVGPKRALICAQSSAALAKEDVPIAP